MTEELYKRYRPKKFSEVIGQEDAINTLNGFGKNLPHFLMITGPSGVGKTTIARILRRKLKCSKHDFREMNCGNFRGIDMVREIAQRMGLAPMKGKSRIWLIDEGHKLTSDAQDSFLKMLEDTPKHVYFLLATTDPDKLKNTIRNRATEIKVRSLSPKEAEGLLESVLKKEGKKIVEDVTEKIVELAEGSARKALVLLNQVIGIEDTKDQLEALEKADVKKQGFQIAQALIESNMTWKKMAGILKLCTEDPEGVRHVVLAYMSSVLLGGRPNAQAYLVIDSFRDSFYQSKRAGLVAACYDVVVGENSEKK